MNNRFFGNADDYHKYGILRLLADGGRHCLAICWMLTPDDDGPVGKDTGYLQQTAEWRRHDPVLYDRLKDLVEVRGIRAVHAAETAGLVPGARFYSDTIPHEHEARERYWDGLAEVAKGCDMVFFDPDVGIAPKSAPYGRKASSRYIYCREVRTWFSAAYSLLVYQHFARQERSQFIADKVRKLQECIGARRVLTLQTANVVFLLAPQEKHLAWLATRVSDIERRWGDRIKFAYHGPS